MRSRTPLAVLGVLAATAALGGCSPVGSTIDKAGGDTEPVTLRLGTPEGDDAPYVEELRFLARRVAELTDQAVTIDVVFDAAPPFDKESEKRLAALVGEGGIDLAVVPARAWELVGVDAFRALQVPQLVDSTELFHAVVQSEVADRMLGGLEPAGVTGLGMLPESLRHPVGYSDELTSVADFDGARLQWSNSPTTAGLAEALGVEITLVPNGAAAVNEGQLDGTESSFVWIQTLPVWGGPVTGNLVLYAKAHTIVANAEVLAALPARAQNAVRAAVDDTVQFALNTDQPDSSLAAWYCEQGGRVVLSTPEELAEIAVRVAPYLRSVTADPAVATAVEKITAIKAELGPQPAVRACVPRPDPTPTPTDEAELSFPEGLYRTDSPRDGIVMMSWDDGVWTRHSADGAVDCKAYYEVRGGRVYLTFTDDVTLSCGAPAGIPLLDAQFTLEGDQLRLTDIQHTDPRAREEFSLPWTRIESR